MPGLAEGRSAITGFSASTFRVMHTLACYCTTTVSVVLWFKLPDVALIVAV